MTLSSPRNRSGRPKDPAKRAAIVATAESLFARQPYETVTMEEVAAQAGVSKMTVYSHFTDKETLFETVVRRISDQMTGALSADSGSGRSLQQRLTDLGIVFLTVILGPGAVLMARSMPAALHHNPALATRFYKAGPERTNAALAAVIAAAADAGELVVDSPKMAADDLVSLWAGALPAQIAFGLAKTTTTLEIEQRSRRGTEVFLRAYGRRPRNTGDGGT